MPWPAQRRAARCQEAEQAARKTRSRSGPVDLDVRQTPDELAAPSDGELRAAANRVNKARNRGQNPAPEDLRLANIYERLRRRAQRARQSESVAS